MGPDRGRGRPQHVVRRQSAVEGRLVQSGHECHLATGLRRQQNHGRPVAAESAADVERQGAQVATAEAGGRPRDHGDAVDVRGGAGKNMLKREFLERFNSMLFTDGYDRIYDVLFEEFMIQ